jgi:hypothetical protein
MMTIGKASRITGADVSVNQNPQSPGSWFAYICGEDGQPRMGKVGNTQAEALQALVDQNYRDNSKLAMERAGWKCERCGSAYKPLQAHHRKYRSHGRDDRVENLEILDFDCHQRAHQKGKH